MMCLDHSSRLYALVVADVGSGATYAFVIGSRHPPDGLAIYRTYLCRWDVYFGPHKLLITDRDAIFTSTESTDRWQALGIEITSVGSYQHFGMGTVERRIQLFKFTVDRLRVEAPPTSVTGWEIALLTISNQLMNEEDFSRRTPSHRLLGANTSLLRKPSPTRRSLVQSTQLKIVIFKLLKRRVRSTHRRGRTADCGGFYRAIYQQVLTTQYSRAEPA